VNFLIQAVCIAVDILFILLMSDSLHSLPREMSASLIPEAQKDATEEQTSVQKMLIENGRLIEAIAEYQRLGRLAEATKYQELLHRNLLYLGKLVDPQLVQQLDIIRVQAPAVEPPAETQQPPADSGAPQPPPVGTASNGTASPQQAVAPMNGTMASPAQQAQHPPMNGGAVGPPPLAHSQTSPMPQQPAMGASPQQQYVPPPAQ